MSLETNRKAIMNGDKWMRKANAIYKKEKEIKEHSTKYHKTEMN